MISSWRVHSTWRRAHAVLFLGIALAAGGATPAQHRSYERQVDGYTLHLGVVPAESVRGHPKSHPESTMHGGPPRLLGSHHVMIAIARTGTGAEVANAHVTARIGEIGLGKTVRALEPMLIAGRTSYGNYFPMRSGAKYQIEIQFRVSPSALPLTARFDYEHWH